MYRKILILLFPCLVFISCKKESDTYSPQITITKPYENQQFIVGEEISVYVEICDDRMLEYIDVSITDENFVTAFHGGTYYPENNCYTLNNYIEIDDMQLLTGNYYILIKASDGVNETKKFLKIHIAAAPKKINYFLVVTKNENNLSVYKIDSANIVTLAKTIISDYCGSAVSSDAQQFYVAGNYMGNISVFSLSDWQQQWSIPVIVNPPFPYFEKIDVHASQLYVSYRDGKFEIYNQTGSIITSRVIENGEYPLKFLPFNNYLITYEISPDGLQKHLIAYHVPSMTIYKKILINFEIQDIYPFDNDNCLLFCNNEAQGIIKLFTLSSGDVTNKTIHSGIIRNVTRISSSDYLFVSDNAIWYYNYEAKGILLWKNAQNCQYIVYDETESNYYYSQDYFNVYKRGLLSSASPVVFTFPDTVLTILPVYNKD